MRGAALQDTIAAVATPPGRGGIGIVRVSGALAEEICERVFRPARVDHPLLSHRFYFGHVVDPSNHELLDEAMAVLMRAPRTYTREDCLEIQVHGGRAVVQEVLSAVISCGARLAQPGEFTLRAFLNGRIDLAQAEAVVDVVEARSRSALRIAQDQLQGALSQTVEKWRANILEALSLVEASIDFPEEELPELGMRELMAILEPCVEDLQRVLGSYTKGRLFKEGASVLIVGPVNVGKSSLLNALVGFERAIVTDAPGTTRDLVEEPLEWKGLPIRAVDTAGIRTPRDPVEARGQELLKERVSSADLLVWVVDSSSPQPPLLGEASRWLEEKPCVVAWNKVDLPPRLEPSQLPEPLRSRPLVRTSALRSLGVEELLDAVHRELVANPEPSDRIIVHARHRVLLGESLAHLERAKQMLMVQPQWQELLAEELRASLGALDELLGRGQPEEVLSAIFSKFCIGK